MSDNPRGRTYTAQQKIGFVLLLIFAFLVIGLGGLQMRNNIYKSFIIRAPKVAQADLVNPIDEQAKLQMQDTDHDGLSDYDELNNYGTSPYLADTDSDGIPDKKEIEQGADPNCAVGKICSAGTDVNTNTSTITSPLAGESGTGLDLLQQFGQQVKDTAAASANFVTDNGQVDPGIIDLVKDPKVLRAQILATGKVTKEALDKIDDATLLNMAKNLINSQSQQVQNVNTKVLVTSTVKSKN